MYPYYTEAENVSRSLYQLSRYNDLEVNKVFLIEKRHAHPINEHRYAPYLYECLQQTRPSALVRRTGSMGINPLERS